MNKPAAARRKNAAQASKPAAPPISKSADRLTSHNSQVRKPATQQTGKPALPEGARSRQAGTGIQQLLEIMARLRSPTGCPWDREQDHRSLRWHAVEEVYELVDAIEAGDDHELEEELGDLLLQVVFHCQLGKERGAFDFEKVARHISDKLIRRHPHVFGETKVKNVDQVWANWEQIKRAEKKGTHRERPSALDGIPRHLPALLRAEKLVKKARRAKLEAKGKSSGEWTGRQLAGKLFELAQFAQARGWSAEELLRAETLRQEKAWRRKERLTHKDPGVTHR